MYLYLIYLNYCLCSYYYNLSLYKNCFCKFNKFILYLNLFDFDFYFHFCLYNSFTLYPCYYNYYNSFNYFNSFNCHIYIKDIIIYYIKNSYNIVYF